MRNDLSVSAGEKDKRGRHANEASRFYLFLYRGIEGIRYLAH